jgi:hypothetical protein
MPNTFELIASSTVGSGGVANIEFTSIPATFTDLVVKLSVRTNRASTEESINIEFNGTGGTAYSSRRLYGSGSGAASDSGSAQAFTKFYSVTGGNATASTFGNAEIYVPNYAGSTSKSVSVDAVTENNATDATAGLMAGLTTNTAAITSIKLTPGSSGTIQQYSTAYLYGVKNA